MSGRTTARTDSAKGFVLGRKNFAAISRVEGLALRSESEQRLERTLSLPSSERRAETIRAFRGAKNGG
jgi:hypothetical protein